MAFRAHMVPFELNLAEHRLGAPQTSGALTVVPLFGPEAEGRFAPPLTGLKLDQVQGYGTVVLENPGHAGLAIVPLHIGYVQDKAQNHALCRAAFIGTGQKVVFHDACCVQESQGGYLEGRQNQWFFILPLALRHRALELRGRTGYSKLWQSISELNSRCGLGQRGHLEELIGRQKPVLTQFQSRFELLEGQTGALFLLDDRLVGVEVAPTAAYFAEVWVALVCFCYGAAAWQVERRRTARRSAPFAASSLAELRVELQRSRDDHDQRVERALAATPRERFAVTAEESYLDFRLETVVGQRFSGQVVRRDDRLVYASIAAGRSPGARTGG